MGDSSESGSSSSSPAKSSAQKTTISLKPYLPEFSYSFEEYTIFNPLSPLQKVNFYLQAVFAVP